jgi:hypothetical protein
MNLFAAFPSHFVRTNCGQIYHQSAISCRENFIYVNLTTFLPLGDEVQNAVISTPYPLSLTP